MPFILAYLYVIVIHLDDGPRQSIRKHIVRSSVGKNSVDTRQLGIPIVDVNLVSAFLFAVSLQWTDCLKGSR